MGTEEVKHNDFPFRVGDKASLSKVITNDVIVSFANLVGDHNPLHLADEYAQRTRFKGRVAHGMLAVSLISAVIGNRLPGAGAIYLSQAAKFLRPVRPGDTITATVVITETIPRKHILRLQTICVNQHQEVVVTGEAEVLFEPTKSG